MSAEGALEQRSGDGHAPLPRPSPHLRALPGGAPPGAGLGVGTLTTLPVGELRLASGRVLRDVVVAFRHDGLPPPAPQILVVHALTGSADAAGDWWAPLIGDGRALDTARVGVLCANLLGGRYGTTGPDSIDPTTGVRYGSGFPPVTPRDQAAAQWALLDALGIDRLALVAGGSLGGMVALEVALARPETVTAVAPIAAPAAVGPMALAWNDIQVALIDRLGDEGLDLARRHAMTTYRSEADFAERFGREVGADGRPSISSYLAHQGRKLVERFDTDTYRTLVRAMDAHDIGAGRGGTRAALQALATVGTRLVGVGIEGDILYGPAQVQELVADAHAVRVEASYREIRSTKGHDAFLVEWEQLSAVLGEALAARG